jgi:stringent starvation protein B
MNLDILFAETLEAQRQLSAARVVEPTQPAQPKKRAALERLLAQGGIQVQVDATLPGVNVPDAWGGDMNLRLNFSVRFDINDLVVTDEAIEQTLSFQGKNHRVRVPLRAVMAARSLKTGEPCEFIEFTGEPYQDPPPKEPT